MYLSRVTVDPQVFKKRVGTYEIHQFVCDFFGNYNERSFLYRVSEMGRKMKIFINSAKKPQTKLEGVDIETRSWDVPYHEDIPYKFLLRANLTTKYFGKKHNIYTHTLKKNNLKGNSIILQETVLGYFSKRKNDFGFEIITLDSSYPKDESFYKGKSNKITLKYFDIEGFLKIVDPIKFKKTMQEGIGNSKGFGFGMLMLKTV